MITSPAQSATCSAAEIRTGIVRFFTSWNRRDRVAFGKLFDADSAFAFAGKHQNTIKQNIHGYTEVGGRGMIVALAEHQWALGERLLYRDVTADTGPGTAGNGGGATVVARFPDGTAQRMVEAKFIYDCAARAFAHVVIISAMAARHDARPWSWRMP
ncbi:MAG TPA: hypothetical protein VIV12_09765 [Streptosporangiaceae bacterium]